MNLVASLKLRLKRIASNTFVAFASLFAFALVNTGTACVSAGTFVGKFAFIAACSIAFRTTGIAAYTTAIARFAVTRFGFYFFTARATKSKTDYTSG